MDSLIKADSPSHTTTLRNNPTTDDLDDLFDYDAGIDDILRDAQAKNQANSDPVHANGNNTAGEELGIDEEITITKKRKPVAKLDDARLLSQNGIPKLRKTAKTKLKLKGKGHEFTDAARLLNFYQLWLDDLFPRAKFEDGLAMIEKLGHSKRMQIMRKEWIDEGKPNRYADLIDELPTTPSPLQTAQHDSNVGTNTSAERLSSTESRVVDSSDLPSQTRNSIFGDSRMQANDDDLFLSDDKNENDQVEAPPAAIEDEAFDELDVLLAEQFASKEKPKVIADEHEAGEEPELDDLDALLAEQGGGDISTTGRLPKESMYDDEMEAMNELDDFW